MKQASEMRKVKEANGLRPVVVDKTMREREQEGLGQAAPLVSCPPRAVGSPNSGPLSVHSVTTRTCMRRGHASWTASCARERIGRRVRWCVVRSVHLCEEVAEEAARVSARAGQQAHVYPQIARAAVRGKVIRG